MLTAACKKTQSSEEVARYKASLRLQTTALSYRVVMKNIIDENLHVMLERIARTQQGAALNNTNGKGDSGLTEPYKLALDMGVRIENLMRRADWSEFKGREIDPSAFDTLVRRSIDQADDLARAAVAQSPNLTQQAADQLLTLCQSCHESYR
jgi:hypothetical protein